MSYTIGNLFGRLLISYVLVWIVLWLASKFQWREAFRKTRRWYGVATVLIVFVLGVLVAASQKSLA